MPQTISPQVLQKLLASDSIFALIDVREAGEYNSSHIAGASLIPRRELEETIAAAVPHAATPIVVCDDDGRRAALAAAALEKLGYNKVSVLEQGINNWVSQGLPTEWGVNVPSKDFGEKVEVTAHVPEVDAATLHQWQQAGKKLVILDSRTPEEYQRFCIPGGRSVPGGELALRITDITKELDPDTTVVVNCAGRTRSIIGARVLQRMGIKNQVVGLRNGTSGWTLAGFQLEQGANRVELPKPSPEGLAAAEAYADRLAQEDGVRFLTLAQLDEMLARRRQEPVYFIDVRAREEYQQSHAAGFRWFPGGQAVQRSDDVAVVHNCPIVFMCDRKARSTITASWYRQMGHREVYAVQGGLEAWAASGRPVETGMPPTLPLGLAEARNKISLISPQQLNAQPGAVAIFVDTSQDFARGHVPGSHWIPRGWLEFRIAEYAPDRATPITVTDVNGNRAILAAATLKDLGYAEVNALAGGLRAWQQAGLPTEKGLSGVMNPPNDVVPAGPDRSFADMQNYLRWEEALGHKYRKG